MNQRRDFLKALSLMSAAAFNPGSVFGRATGRHGASKIACQQYTWFSYYQREGMEWMKDMDESLAALVESGLGGYEPSFTHAGEVGPLVKQLKRHKISATSMYVNSALHEPELVEQSMEDVLSIAREAHAAGIEILVTNPTPIRWGGPEDKSDEQLKTQALALNVLGKELKSLGMTLAYHNHDTEMRQSAREFHHMLTGTDPEFVKLCLDAHWIYRGSGNSEIALFDIVELYAGRIVEVHLRQSEAGIWSETFGEGDIDYRRLVQVFRRKKISPHLVLEQAVEGGTPQTMTAVQAIGKSLEYTEQIFAGLY